MTALRTSLSREERLALDREKYANDPVAQQARRDRHARYRERHRENHRRWYEANRDERIEADRRWRAENPDKARAKARRQNRRKRLGRNAESVEYATIVMADPCVYCGQPAEHLDHINAKARGGSNEWTNLTGACADCNIRKGDAPLLMALLRRPLRQNQPHPTPAPSTL
jgi:5-methylcytosine-specific restriction endonuclease McrA